MRRKFIASVLSVAVLALLAEQALADCIKCGYRPGRWYGVTFSDRTWQQLQADANGCIHYRCGKYVVSAYLMSDPGGAQ